MVAISRICISILKSCWAVKTNFELPPKYANLYDDVAYDVSRLENNIDQRLTIHNEL